MHRTLWTLVLALLLQLTAGSGWASVWVKADAEPAAVSVMHCHESGGSGQVSDAASAGQTGVQVSSHHCCAVGIGMVIPWTLLNLPQAAPRSAKQLWGSWQASPQLRPPI